jgi:alkaline phosphatase D
MTPVAASLALRVGLFAAAAALLAFPPLARAQSLVAGPWSGNTTPSSASVSAVLDRPGISARVVASTSPDLTQPTYSAPVVSTTAAGNAVRLELAGLAADTTYHYAVELDGVRQTSGDLVGTLRTHPLPGARSFKISFGACGDYHNASQFVYQAIRNESPLLFLHLGDMNYQDIDSPLPESYRAVYTAQLTTGGLRHLARHVPIAYVWDDHDFAGNDSNKTNVGRAASRQVYRERVPHYPLPAGGPDAAIHQTFTIGRVRFILTDLRSERDPNTLPDDARKSMMGAAQKQWFKEQLVAARDARAPLVIWVSSVPFVSSETRRDNWGSYTAERAELLTFIRDQDIRNLLILSGDMHALAIDDGAGTAALVSGVQIPIFHAGALARPGSVKGGPYSVDGVAVAPSPGLGRYANLIINDDGVAVTVTYEGRIATGSGSTLTGVSTWRSYAYQPVAPDPVIGKTVAPAPTPAAADFSPGPNLFPKTSHLSP